MYIIVRMGVMPPPSALPRLRTTPAVPPIVVATAIPSSSGSDPGFHPVPLLDAPALPPARMPAGMFMGDSMVSLPKN